MSIGSVRFIRLLRLEYLRGTSLKFFGESLSVDFVVIWLPISGFPILHFIRWMER